MGLISTSHEMLACAGDVGELGDVDGNVKHGVLAEFPVFTLFPLSVRFVGVLSEHEAVENNAANNNRLFAHDVDLSF